MLLLRGARIRVFKRSVPVASQGTVAGERGGHTAVAGQRLQQVDSETLHA